MKEQPFYYSKKFAYAIVMLLAAVALALLPSALKLDAQQTDTLNNMIPYVLGFGFALIGGHSVLDALSMAQGLQVPTINEAVEGVIDAINDPESIKS